MDLASKRAMVDFPQPGGPKKSRLGRFFTPKRACMRVSRWVWPRKRSMLSGRSRSGRGTLSSLGEALERREFSCVITKLRRGYPRGLTLGEKDAFLLALAKSGKRRTRCALETGCPFGPCKRKVCHGMQMFSTDRGHVQISSLRHQRKFHAAFCMIGYWSVWLFGKVLWRSFGRWEDLGRVKGSEPKPGPRL